MKGFGKSRTGRKPEGGGQRSPGGKRTAEEAQSTGRSNEMPEAGLIRPVAEAEVTGIEAHPKQPGMYRIAIRLYGEQEPDVMLPVESNSNMPPASEPDNWNDEVDALIAGAAKASNDDRHETVVTVHEDTLVGMRLLKGRRLAPEEWEILRREEAQEEAYRASLAILERKARTSRELADALKRKGYAADVIQSCLERLKTRRMLDDSAYARRYTEQRAAGQRKGRRLIRQELLQRGIAKEDADQALEELDGDVELEAALALARKKWPQLKGEQRERKMKLTAFLLRRGYPNGIVKSAVESAISEAASLGDDVSGFRFDTDEDSGSPDWEMNDITDADMMD